MSRSNGSLVAHARKECGARLPEHETQAMTRSRKLTANGMSRSVR
jgi:hypothetical protein